MSQGAEYRCDSLPNLPISQTSQTVQQLLKLHAKLCKILLQVLMKHVKSWSGGCQERSGDRKPTVSLTVATTVSVSHIPYWCRDSRTRILRDDTPSCSPCFAAALLPHSAVCYQQQLRLRQCFDLPSSSSTPTYLNVHLILIQANTVH